MKKKVISVLLTTVMACAALAGCGSSAGETEATQTEAKTQEESAKT